jgi:hypothetical protein
MAVGAFNHRSRADPVSGKPENLIVVGHRVNDSRSKYLKTPTYLDELADYRLPFMLKMKCHGLPS